MSSNGQLRKLADDITPSALAAKRGHQIMDKFVREIQQKLSIVSVHKGGSIGKRTAIWLKMDFDILVFVDEQEVSTRQRSSFVRQVQSVLLQARFPLEKMECKGDRFSWYISPRPSAADLVTMRCDLAESCETDLAGVLISFGMCTRVQ